MFRKTLTLMAVATVAGLIGLMSMIPAAAQQGPSASRSFDSASVAPGGEIVVTIAASDYGSAGRVTETLPAGFTYVSSNLSEGVRVTGQEVRFTLFGDSSFTYTVTASDVAGFHDFGGVLRNFDQDEFPVGGATVVTVEAAAEPTVEATVEATVEPGTGTAAATRSFDSASVSAGGQVVVTITASDYGSAGRVTETLPAGFTYVSSNLSEGVRVTGQDVRFTLFGDASFTYTVTASSVAGSHDFSGVLRDFEQSEYTVGGAVAVMVEASGGGAASASRSFAPASVSGGGEVVVTITASDYGSAGRVTETLPAGFTYVSSNLSEGVRVTGQEVRFTLFGDASFTYTVTASSVVGSHSFSGVLRDFEQSEYTVGGAATVTVESSGAGGASASRSFAPASVSPGGQVVITISASDYGSAGRVTETLPAGFTYVSSNLSEGVRVTGQEVRFTLFGDTSFTYTVTASSVVGSHAFSGVLRDFEQNAYTVGGVSSIRVGTVTPPDTGGGGGGGGLGGGGVSNSAPVFREGAAAARAVAENAAPGTLVGDRVTAFDNDANTITYSFARNPDADSFTLDAQTGQIAVATGASLDFEVKNSYAVTVRASDRQGGADAIAVTIAVTNVDEAGAVSLSSEDPRIGTPLEAMLTDPDGGMADVSWQWERSPDQTSWLAVFGANAASYTPTEADAGQHLRVTVSYSDNHGAGKRAHRETANPVPDLAATPTPTAVPPTPTPTAAPPTTTPTSVPTVAPTAVPTVAPTAVPTAAPTAVPTAAPTAIPTVAPTAVPTVAPTAVPTAPPPATATSVAPVVVDEGGGLPIWLIVLLAIGVLVVIGTLVLLRFRVQ